MILIQQIINNCVREQEKLESHAVALRGEASFFIVPIIIGIVYFFFPACQQGRMKKVKASPARGHSTQYKLNSIPLTPFSKGELATIKLSDYIVIKNWNDDDK